MMAGQKDLFSSHASLYATFRPNYPPPLYDFLFHRVQNFNMAWDCATGNGQVATYLAGHFIQVVATDLSQSQLDYAPVNPRILYRCEPAESTSLKDKSVDLVTVAQAIHWFDFDKFYKEVKRVVRPEGIIAVWGYHLPSISESVDRLLHDFYRNKTGPYWDAARRFIDEHYATIPFPFEEINCPAFSHRLSWTSEHLAGYLSSWSATRGYMKANGNDPVPGFMEQLSDVLPAGSFDVTFPLFLRLGRVHS